MTGHRIIRILIGDKNAHIVIVESGREGIHVLFGDIEDVVVQEHEPLPAEHPGDNQSQVALHAQITSLARSEQPRGLRL